MLERHEAEFGSNRRNLFHRARAHQANGDREKALAAVESAIKGSKGLSASQIASKTKLPHHITVEGADVFGLAGLWESWQDPAGNELETCAILTCAPNEMMADIHERMPAILPPERYDAWLNPDQQDAAQAARLLRPFPADQMAAVPVSTYVNKAGNEGEKCIEPLGQQGLFG